MDGIWLACDFTLEAGEEVMLSFVPPGAEHSEILATARVARVCAREGEPSGMGLAFSFMRSTDRAVLARSLEGRPPPLPGRRPPAELPAVRALPQLSATG
jgi:hypothetical protein